MAHRVLVASVCLLSTEACDGENTSALEGGLQNVQLACPPPAGLPADAWVCPAPLAVECGAPLPPLYVSADPGASCSAETLRAEVPASTVGDHQVVVRRSDGSVACTSSLSIVDSVKPVIEPQTIRLWPPNHKLHAISVSDCVHVSDACQPELEGEFIWASSDEPIDGLGDGHHAPDIVFDDCGHVQVRAERAGPNDGRVYRLGVRVVDAAGNTSESSCTVVVDHSGNGQVAVESGSAYRVELDGTDGKLACDGVTTPAQPQQPSDPVLQLPAPPPVPETDGPVI